MPIMIVIRDMLGLCDNASEGVKILSGRDVLVDGRVVTDPKFPVGLMDVVSIPKINQHYRMVLDRNGKLRLVTVPEGKEKWKLCRIEDKTTVTGGKTQLNLHDGRNVLVEKDDFKLRRRAEARGPIPEDPRDLQARQGQRGAHRERCARR